MSEPEPLSGKEGASRFSSIDGAIEHFRSGGIAILVDDESRENEGDFCIAAEKVSPETINFMTKEGRGLVCLALTSERVEALGLPMMVPRSQNGSSFTTAFTVSIEARKGVTTGISAQDRAHTIATAIDPEARPSDLVAPGHVFPLRARPEGVLRRAGHTEAVVDFARLAGLDPSGVICEILRDDGTMARLPDLEAISRRHDLPLVTIKDLIAYRMRHERLIVRTEEGELPTKYGTFRVVGYMNQASGRAHMALVLGEADSDEPTLVRVQPADSVCDFLGLLRSDCTDRLENALAAIQREGHGVLVFLQVDAMGEEANRLKEPSAPVLREYGIGAQILVDLGLRRIRIMTNDERRIVALEGYGLELEERLPLEVESPLPGFRRLGKETGKPRLQRS